MDPDQGFDVFLAWCIDTVRNYKERVLKVTFDTHA